MRLQNDINELEKALIVKGYSFIRGTNRKTLKIEKQILQPAQLESCSLDPSTYIYLRLQAAKVLLCKVLAVALYCYLYRSCLCCHTSGDPFQISASQTN